MEWELVAGVGVRMGGTAEEVCGGTGSHVVAEYSRSGFTFPVSQFLNSFKISAPSSGLLLPVIFIVLFSAESYLKILSTQRKKIELENSHFF